MEYRERGGSSTTLWRRKKALQKEFDDFEQLLCQRESQLNPSTLDEEFQEEEALDMIWSSVESEIEDLDADRDQEQWDEINSDDDVESCEGNLTLEFFVFFLHFNQIILMKKLHLTWKKNQKTPTLPLFKMKIQITMTKIQKRCRWMTNLMTHQMKNSPTSHFHLQTLSFLMPK